MTTRFSLAELAEMLHVRVGLVREAVDDLAADNQLTAESFIFADRNWRVAPNDVKRIKEWIEARAAHEDALATPKRRIKRKRIQPASDSSQEV